MNSQSSYTGRKIRFDKSKENELAISTIISGEDSKEKLCQMLDLHLAGYSEKHLIGVFGRNSDIVTNHVMSELAEKLNNKEIAILPKSYYLRDLPTLFGLSIYSCLRNDGRLKKLTETYELPKQLSFILYNEELGMGINNKDETENRASACKNLMEYIKLFSNMKFIWNIEIPYYKCNRNLLYLLSKMTSDNFIIVVNFIRTIETEARLITKEYERNEELGKKLIREYLSDYIVITN